MTIISREAFDMNLSNFFSHQTIHQIIFFCHIHGQPHAGSFLAKMESSSIVHEVFQDRQEDDFRHESNDWLPTWKPYKSFERYDPNEKPAVESGWSFTHRLPSMYHHVFHPQKIRPPPIVDHRP